MRQINHELDVAVRKVRDRRGVDLTGYKRTFLRRRVEHRASMRLCRSLGEYLALLESDPIEMDELLNALRLKVTTFFRDPATWKILEERFLPDLILRRQGERCLRAWSAGCSTGQEAYSLAIAIAEVLETQWKNWTVTIFATNTDTAALKKAGMGVYSPKLLEGLEPARMQRWMEPLKGNQRQFRPELRRRVHFLAHDVRVPPPFMPVDLILCRNLLMYFERDSQKQILQTLRRSLTPDGILVLGSGEFVPDAFAEFEVLDQLHHIYRADGHRYGSSAASRP